MQIQVNSDSHINVSAEFVQEIKDELESSLKRFAQQLTRLEVHLGDENSHKGGDRDKRCLIEARLAGRDPVAATAEEATLDVAISSAIKKLETQLARMLGRLADRKGRTSFAGEQGDFASEQEE